MGAGREPDMDVAGGGQPPCLRRPDRRMGRVAYDLGNVYQAPGVWHCTTRRCFSGRCNAVSPSCAPQVAGAPDFTRRARSHRPGDGATGPGAHAAARCRADRGRVREHRPADAPRLPPRRLLLLDEAGRQPRPRARRSTTTCATSSASTSASGWPRNRPGGLTDSVARLEKARADYGIA